MIFEKSYRVQGYFRAFLRRIPELFRVASVRNKYNFLAELFMVAIPFKSKEFCQSRGVHKMDLSISTVTSLATES